MNLKHSFVFIGQSKLSLKKNTLFDAQNAGNWISEVLNFKLFGGNMPPDPPCGKGPYIPACCHTRLFYLQQPLVKKIIETHVQVR